MKIMVALLCLCSFIFCGCVPSSDFLKQKEQGYFIDTSDFPNTEWVCQELGISFYMLDCGERYMVGSYEFEGQSYRLIATFEFDELNFKFYSLANDSLTEYNDSDAWNSLESCGFIYTNYSFDKETNAIVCSLRNYETNSGENIPASFTFKLQGTIAQKPQAKWYASEIDMYLMSFDDARGYYSGEMVVDGQKSYIHAFEIINNLYVLSIENGMVNNLSENSTSVLILMHFEMNDNEITATVADRCFSNPENYPYWKNNNTTITFCHQDS